MTRSQAITALRQALRTALAAVVAVAEDARSEATGAESKQEGQYDTRATEASYLARGQGQRVLELRRLASWFENLQLEASPDSVGLGTLVRLGGDKSEWLLVAPVGGTHAEVEGEVVRVVSPSAPLGAAIMGLELDDAVEFVTPKGVIEVIVEVLT
jgi:transcription elongation GreA/GreB family factor